MVLILAFLYIFYEVCGAEELNFEDFKNLNLLKDEFYQRFLYTEIPDIVNLPLSTELGTETRFLTRNDWTTISTWWRHQMETISVLLAFCAGNSPATGESPAQRQVTRSFDVFFYLRLNKRLSKQSWDWWFETPSRALYRHCNANSHQASMSHCNQ